MNNRVGKIVHVMFDEKFNDMAIRQFESAIPDIHEYWVLSKNIRLTKSLLVKQCTRSLLVARLSGTDVTGVIFHSLPSHNYPLLNKINPNAVVVWIGWGYDYYPLLDHRRESSVVLDKTKVISKESFHVRLKRKIKYSINKILRNNDYLIKGLNRVDFFSPVLDLEFDLVMQHLNLNAQYVEWNYGTVEDDLLSSEGNFSKGQNILVGNSASSTNNHIELFEKIAENINLEHRKLIVPLSYGDSRYRDKIISIGQVMFGESFVPLTEFMPVEKYISVMQSCGFAMMNHLRQQALGNICIAMLQGSKIYLNEKNPLADWLSRRGAIFGSINNLDMQPLSLSEKVVNSKIIFSHWGRAVQKLKTENLINKILTGNKNKIEI